MSWCIKALFSLIFKILSKYLFCLKSSYSSSSCCSNVDTSCTIYLEERFNYFIATWNLRSLFYYCFIWGRRKYVLILVIRGVSRINFIFFFWIGSLGRCCYKFDRTITVNKSKMFQINPQVLSKDANCSSNTNLISFCLI